MSKNTENNLYNQHVKDNPEASEVWSFIMDAAKSFEEERGFSRRQICEGIFIASLDLAERNIDDQFFQRPNEVRNFHVWAFSWITVRIKEYITLDQQEAYEEKHGEDGLFGFDASDFGWVKNERKKN